MLDWLGGRGWPREVTILCMHNIQTINHPTLSLTVGNKIEIEQGCGWMGVCYRLGHTTTCRRGASAFQWVDCVNQRASLFDGWTQHLVVL